jgi:hypothetical protein
MPANPAPYSVQRPAECNSAIRQIANLRYNWLQLDQGLFWKIFVSHPFLKTSGAFRLPQRGSLSTIGPHEPH